MTLTSLLALLGSTLSVGTLVCGWIAERRSCKLPRLSEDTCEPR